jgi:hypothetical protein
MSTVADIQAVSNVFVRLLKPAPRITLGNGKEAIRGELTYLLDKESLATVLPMISPGTRETISVLGVSVERIVGLIHEDFDTMLAVGYDVEYVYGSIVAFGLPNTGTENLVRVTVRYEAPPYSISGDDAYLQVQFSRFDRDLPASGLLIGSETPSYDITREASGLRYNVTVFDSPNADQTTEAAWVAYCDRVLADYFRGTPGSQVLYKGPTGQYTYKQDGTRACTYTLTFDASPYPWNQLYNRAGALTAATIGGSPVYGSVALADIIK